MGHTLRGPWACASAPGGSTSSPGRFSLAQLCTRDFSSAVSAFGQYRKFLPHERKASVTQGTVLLGLWKRGKQPLSCIRSTRDPAHFSVSIDVFFFYFEVLDLHAKEEREKKKHFFLSLSCLLYTSPSPRDQRGSRMPSSA